MVATMPRLITDHTTLVDELQRALWRDAARRAGIAEADIERSVWFKWRVERAGGVAVVIRGLGRMQRMVEPT